MQLTFGPGVVRNVIPDAATWALNTPDAGGHWYTRTVNRSVALQGIDRSLATFQATPSLTNFGAIQTAYNTWRLTKLNRHAQVISRRRAASDNLEGDLARHRSFLDGRNQVKARVELGLSALQWKNRAICAELYSNPNDPGWNPLLPEDILALELEANVTSRWANVIPPTLAGWHDVGAAERQRLANWPNLTAGVGGITIRSALLQRLNINAAAGQWPPWQGRAAFVRKGLFCHSFAALAAEYLYANRVALEAGTQFRIHSISVIHQQAADVGGMTHWWVAVNAPTQINLGGGAIRTLNLCNDYAVLDLVGGFVVDIWGSLWIDQLGNEHARATSNAATAGDCVWTVPNGDFLGNTQAIVRAREAWA